MKNVKIRGQNFMEGGGAVILNPEFGNRKLLGTGASPSVRETQRELNRYIHINRNYVTYIHFSMGKQHAFSKN